eukprot:TRINITY_DN8005_c0_g1_i1.p1 TRINITY_DN8005_c0_g1~~TRINITY_DN8005_c0_g1_i1.p1  ORF type:complete len:212 (-),score=35.44 TRINITY_DN8005_c0_g1_i1:85-675(-)
MPSFTTAAAAAALLLASVLHAARVKMLEDMDLGADDAAQDADANAHVGVAAASVVGGSVYTSSAPQIEAWGNPKSCTVTVCNAVLECFKKSDGRDPKTGGNSSLGSCWHITHRSKACMWSWSLKVPKLKQRKCGCYKVKMYPKDSYGYGYAEGSQYTACPSDCEGLNKTACAEKLQLKRWDQKCLWSSHGNRVACG